MRFQILGQEQIQHDWPFYCKLTENIFNLNIEFAISKIKVIKYDTSAWDNTVEFNNFIKVIKYDTSSFIR